MNVKPFPIWRNYFMDHLIHSKFIFKQITLQENAFSYVTPPQEQRETFTVELYFRLNQMMGGKHSIKNILAENFHFQSQRPCVDVIT